MPFFKSKKIIILFVLATIILGSFIGGYIFKNRYTLLQSEVVQLVVPLYHSFRKIPDIFFIPLAIFNGSEIEEQYDIFIPYENIITLNNNLVDKPFSGVLKEENKVWVSAQFRSGDYNEQVKIRYRGNLANHWNSYKKSYIIKFPKENLFNGMRELSLIIPIDRKYFSTSLNNYRARKMGLVVPDEFYSRVSVNGGQAGVYLSMEHWSQEWIEKMPISSLSKIYGTTDGENLNDVPSTVSIYSKVARDRWESWNNDSLDFPEVDALITLAEEASDEDFEKMAPILLDLESFYALDTLYVLTGGYHLSDDGNNLILIFDATEGRWKPVPFNASLTDPKTSVANAPQIQKRVWSVPKFREARDEYFEKYVSENKEDDLKFVDSWIKKMKKEFYLDNAKLENNFSLLRDLKNLQVFVGDHFNRKISILDDESDLQKIPDSNSVTFPEQFKYLKDALISPEEFVSKHPEFYLSNSELFLYAGNYLFTKDLIIPRNTKLTIYAGATLQFNPKISLISYSPVDLVGNEKSSVSFEQAVKGRNWGVFAVINADNRTSRINFSKFDGGGEANINGVYISGMAAFHNSDVDINNSLFSNTSGDDALNIQSGRANITNNIFKNNFSDGIDLDFIGVDSLFKNNTFLDNGGDAIDLSWSKVQILDSTVINCGDKGISLGERSNISLISGLKISGCKIGIAVKDQSFARIENTTLENNNIGISLYQKKPVFGGASAELLNLNLLNNANDFHKDDNSLFINLK